MRLLLKLLRPETVPSPNRKKIPFGTRLQLSLYRSCLKTLRRWYRKYAFSDSIVISGNPAIRICHEYRDTAFEAEIKRLRMSLPEGMLERSGASSSQPDKTKRRLYHGCFHFVDHFLMEINDQKISIDHGDGRSFVSTAKGRLKESDVTNLVAKYAFSGSLREDKNAGRKVESIKESIAGKDPPKGTMPEEPVKGTRPGRVTVPRKPGSLFGDDPLLGKTPEKPESPTSNPAPPIKNVEGVSIDESF